jgi:hypothetical protein
MPRTKTYVAFDGDTDIHYYLTLKMWAKNKNIDFELNDAHDLNNAYDDSLPESIINQLRQRLEASKFFILLVGEKTKSNRKGILKYELNYALRNNLPIALSFINFDGTENNDTDLWQRYLSNKIPTLLMEADTKYILVSPFTKNAIEYSIRNYSHMNLPKKGFTWIWKS